MRNRGFTPDGSATVVLDFGKRLEKDRLVLGLTGDNFRRRVTVEGSDDGESWTTLTDDAWVFAIPGPEAARYENVVLPENDFPLLRVSVHPGARERGRIWDSRGLGAGGGGTRPSRGDPVAGLEPGVGGPAGGDLAHPRPGGAPPALRGAWSWRWRTSVSSGRSGPRSGGTWPWATPIARPRRNGGTPSGREWSIASTTRGSCARGCGIDARGRARALRVRILNGDDRPLVITGVRVRVPVERLIFEAEPGVEYRLTYGAPDLAPPVYDLARTLGEDPEASTAELGPPVRRAVEADVLPWSERHPLLLWIGLLVGGGGAGARHLAGPAERLNASPGTD